MGGGCTRSDACEGSCPFACTCFSCLSGHGCHCDCRFVILLQLIVAIVACLVAAVALREKRKFLAIWSSIYTVSSVMMIVVTYARGSDPHDIGFHCSSPFLIWATLVFITSLSCYTSEVILSPESSSSERYVFDPRRRTWIPFVRPHTVGIQ